MSNVEISLEAALEKKVDLAVAELVAQGKDPSKLTEDEITALAMSLDLTRAEQIHCGRAHIERLAAIVIGEKMVSIINANMKIKPDDLRSCMLAYFDALDNGEAVAP